jgi:hypothetical protein
MPTSTRRSSAGSRNSYQPSRLSERPKGRRISDAHPEPLAAYYLSLVRTTHRWRSWSRHLGYGRPTGSNGLSNHLSCAHKQPVPAAQDLIQQPRHGAGRSTPLMPGSNAVCPQPPNAQAGHLSGDHQPRARALGGLFVCVARRHHNFGFSMIPRDSSSCNSPAQVEWPQQFSIETCPGRGTGCGEQNYSGKHQ